VADFSQFRPELAPRGKPIDGQPCEQDRGGEQEHRGGEPETEPVRKTLRDGTDYKPSHFGGLNLSPYPVGAESAEK
jgi:hypothetical protein